MPFQGFISCDQPLVHFGLGMETHIDRLRILWPSGRQQELTGLVAGRHYTVEERGAPEPMPPAPQPLFEASDLLSFARHKENAYDDFAQQELLPYRPSRLGPGMAWGDVDGDGDDDLYLGGAMGKSGELQVNEGGMKFKWRFQKAFQTDRETEDMGALFLDVDGDNDQDLYVVSGGYEQAVPDRLYLNDGEGNFTRAPADALPGTEFSGGSVMAADVDRDGDLDLAVGGRQVPGRYPEHVQSILLRNEAGRFSAEPLPGSKALVSSGCWADINNDNWPDLLLATEWGPVRIYLNRNGSLEEHIDPAAPQGWWNGLAPGDFDCDGDIDFVVTNWGLNTKYKASKKKPAVLYYGDFDQSGKPKIVEAKYEGETLLPVRGKSCSTHCMPILGEKFATFREFALADLQQIYTPEKLDESLELTCDTLEHMLMINDGQGAIYLDAAAP